MCEHPGPYGTGCQSLARWSVTGRDWRTEDPVWRLACSRHLAAACAAIRELAVVTPL